jgi:RNA polymerase sigma-70 factor (ECF subfamily)
MGASAASPGVRGDEKAWRTCRAPVEIHASHGAVKEKCRIERTALRGRMRVEQNPSEPAGSTEVSAAALMRIAPILRGYALKLLRSQTNAEDAVQDALERAWRARDTFRPGADLRPWMFGILRNAIIDRFRQGKYVTQDVDGVEAARLTTQPDQVWRLQYADVVAALRILPADQKRAVVLLMLGATNVEAAATMGCPLGTLKSHLRLARAKLKAAGV